MSEIRRTDGLGIWFLFPQSKYYRKQSKEPVREYVSLYRLCNTLFASFEGSTDPKFHQLTYYCQDEYCHCDQPSDANESDSDYEGIILISQRFNKDELNDLTRDLKVSKRNFWITGF